MFNRRLLAQGSSEASSKYLVLHLVAWTCPWYVKVLLVSAHARNAACTLG